MNINVDAGRALLVIVLTIVGVIVINVAIYYSIKGKSTIGQIEMMRKATRQARNPWEIEDTALQELADIVADLKQASRQEIAAGDEQSERQEKPDE